MEQKTWECLTCGKKFKIGQWTCEDGISNHTVASKEYLLNDAPSDPGFVLGMGMNSQRDGRTRICNIPPDKTVLRDGESHTLPGGFVEFIRGRFSSSDPEVQYWLDRKGGFCDQSAWEAAWLSSDQRHEIERMNMTADKQRLENERNALLEQLKQQKKEPVERRSF